MKEKAGEGVNQAGAAMKAARISRRLPMSAVAAAIGCTAARYARIESGSAAADGREAEAIRAVLGAGSGAE